MKNLSKLSDQARQGDVFLEKVNADEMPVEARKVQRDPDGGLVLARGGKPGIGIKF